MNTTALRDADPAAGAHVMPTSDAADEMLCDILATPRVEAPAHRRRRLVLGASTVGAAAAAAVAVPMLLAGGGSGAASAYAVERHADGSVDISIDFDQFRDPAALQRTLDAQHVPAVVLSGTGSSITVGKDGKIHGDYTRPACSRYRSLGSDPAKSPHDPDQPVSYGTSPRWKDISMRLHPDLLPADGTFVVLITREGHRIAGLAGDVALGQPPTCLP